RVQEAAESCFGKAPRGALASLSLPEEPRQLARKHVSKAFPVELSYFNLAWHIPEVSHPDIPALDVISVILGSGTSSRLNQELREKEGLVYGVGAYAYTPSFPGLFTVSGTCPAKTVHSLPNRVLALARQSFLDHNLEKARRIVTVNAIEQMQTSRGLASDVGISWLYARNANFNRHYLQQIQALTCDDLNRVAQKYLTDQNLTVATLVPKTKMVSRVVRSHRKPEPVLHSFENGAKLITIPDDRLPLVHASLAVRGGCYLENSRTNGLNRLLAQSITKGTRSRTCEQIADEIERLGGALLSDSGYNSIRISVNSLSSDFEKAFELLMDVALEPVFPESATERERESLIAAIQAEKAQPHLLARNLLRAAIFGDHPYGLNPNGNEETVPHLTVQELARQRQVCFVRSNLVLGISGDFATEKMVKLAGNALAHFPMGSGDAWPDLPEVNLSESRVIHSQEKVHQGIVHVGYLVCTMFDADRASLEVFDEITGDSSSRFFQKIREELGLAYSVGSSLFMGFSPGIFSIQAATAPEKVELVTEIIREELMRMALEALSQEEFERGKARMLAQEAFQQQSLDSKVVGAALNELYGLGYNYAQERYKRIEQLTLENVNNVVRKYLMDKPSITVIIRP
ncbi:MAG: insulinase family protein, partial [Verrucomicrobia bacterium]|nr:insulinase family protein [Verrucomicrobiota bacterium]